MRWPAAMAQNHEGIRQKHTLGERTRTRVVRADQTDDRAWLASAPVCPALADADIAHCGVMHATHPMEIIRTELSGTFFLACTEGLGEVLREGRWQVIRPGEACLQPPFITNGLRARRQAPWSFCWVRYRQTSDTPPIATVHSPEVGPFESAGLRAALDGLFAEASGGASLPALGHWVSLVHGYVLAFSLPRQRDDRLIKAWNKVNARLAHAWTLADLADLACVSKEHFRRLCLQDLGRSPMRHLTHMRMTRAAELLVGTNRKIAQVARAVGYGTPFAFSDTFLRWSGARPTDYRRRSHVDAPSRVGR